tara:strand:+ start:5519 stop:6076 length:558 start_codon:yes stop_codon:yes gene_type:complete
MKIIKSKNVQETLLNIVLVIGGLFLIAALLHYGSNKTMHKDMMVSGSNPVPPSKPVASPQVNNLNKVEASTDSVFDSTFSSVSDVLSNSTSMNKQPLMNARELLPRQQNSNSALMNPPRNDLAGKNFLLSGSHIGINTVGNSLQNANQQLRSDPPIPQANVGPWNNTTIEPDTMRRPLEIAGNCN